MDEGKPAGAQRQVVEPSTKAGVTREPVAAGSVTPRSGPTPDDGHGARPRSRQAHDDGRRRRTAEAEAAPAAGCRPTQASPPAGRAAARARPVRHPALRRPRALGPRPARAAPRGDPGARMPVPPAALPGTFLAATIPAPASRHERLCTRDHAAAGHARTSSRRAPRAPRAHRSGPARGPHAAPHRFTLAALRPVGAHARARDPGTARSVEPDADAWSSVRSRWPWSPGAAGGVVGAYLERDGGRRHYRAAAGPRRDERRRAPDSVAGIAAAGAARRGDAPCERRREAGTGTGFVLDERGHILTNNHVVEPAGDDGGIYRHLRGGGEPRRPRSSARTAATTWPSSRSPASPGSTRCRSATPTTSRSATRSSPSARRSTWQGTVTSGIISAKDRPITAGGENGDGATSATSTRCRPTRRSTPATPAARWSTAEARVIGINSAIRAADERLRARRRPGRQHRPRLRHPGQPGQARRRGADQHRQGHPPGDRRQAGHGATPATAPGCGAKGEGGEPAVTRAARATRRASSRATSSPRWTGRRSTAARS